MTLVSGTELVEQAGVYCYRLSRGGSGRLLPAVGYGGVGYVMVPQPPQAFTPVFETSVQVNGNKNTYLILTLEPSRTSSC